MTAKTLDDLKKPLEALLWAVKQASAAGMLPEQMHPMTGAPLSVSPLTWSHAVYAETVLMYSDKLKELTLKKQS